MEVREALSVSGLPVGEHGDEGSFYQVGSDYWRPGPVAAQKCGPVTRITVTADLPGLHCNMERVRVFDGETVIFEAPLHSLEGVTYAAPKGGEA